MVCERLQYTEIDELTAEMLNLFIKRVEVGEREEKWSHAAPQEININYRDIGLMDTVTEKPEELQAPSDPSGVA